MEHILHTNYSHKIEAFKDLCLQFEQENGRNPNTHERAKILSDAICTWAKEENDINHS